MKNRVESLDLQNSELMLKKSSGFDNDINQGVDDLAEMEEGEESKD